MAKNQVIDPRADFALSWPTGSSDTADPSTGLIAGKPVMQGELVGVTITAKEAADGGHTGTVNSNAPGNVSVWSGGLWRLPVDVTSTAGKFGAPVYAVPTANKAEVALKVTPSPTTGAGWRRFGALVEPAAAGNGQKLIVKVDNFAGPEVVS